MGGHILSNSNWFDWRSIFLVFVAVGPSSPTSTKSPRRASQLESQATLEAENGWFVHADWCIAMRCWSSRCSFPSDWTEWSRCFTRAFKQPIPDFKFFITRTCSASMWILLLGSSHTIATDGGMSAKSNLTHKLRHEIWLMLELVHLVVTRGDVCSARSMT